MRLPEELPVLKGRWLAAYKLLWWAVLAVSLVAMTAGQWHYLQQATLTDSQVHGAGLRPNEDGELTFSPLSAAARDAGVVPGSVLLAVDGRPVPDSADLEEIGRMLDGPAGQALTLRLREPDGSRTQVRIVRGPEHRAAADAEAPATYAQRNSIYLGSRVLGSLIVVAGAILLFRRRAHDPVAALLSLGLLAVPGNDLAYLVSDPSLQAAIYNGFSIIPIACIPLALATFPTGRFVPRWTQLVVPAALVWIFAVAMGWDSGSLPVQLAVALPALLLAVASLAWRFVRLEPGQSKQQVKWVMLGFAGFIACGLLLALLIIADGAAADNRTHFAILLVSSALGAAQGFCIVGGLLVALLRYRLYDADAAISRSAVYAGLTVGLVAVFAASEALIQALAQKWFGASAGAAGGAAAAGVAAVLLVPLHHRLSDWAKKRFQRDLTRLRAELPQVLIAIRDSNDPVALADDALRLAIRGVHASHGAILLADGERLALAHAEGISPQGLVDRLVAELPADPAPGVVQIGDPALPARLPLITAGGENVGWLLLGPHPDGSLYGKDDRRALEELAAPLARALFVAIERSRREAEREAERRLLIERLAQLEDTLGKVAGMATPPRAGTA